jgi:hypothetical protein
MMQELLRLRAELFKAKVDDTESVSERKLQIIQSNLYGVDKDLFAVNIAMLRLWLSLAVEAARPIALPNLDFKIAEGDSLLSFPYQTERLRRIEGMKRDYFDPKTPNKSSLKDAIDGEIRSAFAASEKTLGYKVDFDFKINFSEVYHSQKPSSDITGGLLLGDRLAEADKPGGFDIVIANPPYVRQEGIKQRMGEAYKKTLLSIYSGAAEGKSDLYVYFYARGMEILRPGGVHVFVCSNSWLDVGYGGKLQGFLLQTGNVQAIYDSAVERQFSTASVNTIISVIRKGEHKETDVTTFYYLQEAFDDALRPDGNKRIVTRTRKELWEAGIEQDEQDTQDEKNKQKHPAHSVHPVKYLGDKWGGKYLRAPDIYWTILKKGKGKLVRLGDIATVRFGIKTGANEFFYLDAAKIAEWGIEDEFLKPVIKSPRECRGFQIDASQLRVKLFMCHKDKSGLKGTRALIYIADGERKRFNDVPSCRTRRNWWDLGQREMPTLICSSSISDLFRVFGNPGVFADKRMYEIHLDDIHRDRVLASTNSTLCSLFLELGSRTGLGEGLVDLTVYEVAQTIIFNPNNFDHATAIMDRLRKRSSLAFSQEIRDPDRRALDDIIFDALGLTSGEREAVYEAVIDLVTKRLDKAKSV